MPKISFSKESLEGAPPIPNGAYDVRLEGFEPKYSKNRDSVNLNPVLKVVNHATESGKRVFDNMNTRGWMDYRSYVSFGVIQLVQNPHGGDSTSPETSWVPTMTQRSGITWGLCQAPSSSAKSSKSTIRKVRWSRRLTNGSCQVPNCTSKHPANLAG